MPEQNDVTLIVLKGHLLIEEMLEQIIQKVVAHGDIVKGARFSFYQKIILAQAMCWPKYELIWKVVLNINTLRNKLAHQLTPLKLQEKLDKLFDIILKILKNENDSNSIKAFQKADDFEKLRLSFVLILGFLESYRGDSVAYREFIDYIYYSE